MADLQNSNYNYQQNYDQNYQQNPYQATDYNPTYANQQYTYDPYEIQYQHIQFDQWHEIPVDQTEYSQYWSDPHQFEPEQFSKNTVKESRCNDIFWVILFFINVGGTIALFVHVYSKYNIYYSEHKIAENSIKFFLKFFGYGLLIAFGLNLFHFLYATLFPSFYLKFSLLIDSIIATGVAVYFLY